MKLQILGIQEADMRACIADLISHYAKYGIEPQPHKAAEAQKNMDRIWSALDQCWDVVPVHEVGVRPDMASPSR